MIYEFIDGKKAEVKDIVIPKKIEDMFRVNLPSTQKEYENGSGEYVWACTDEDTLKAYREHTQDGIYFVKILSASSYYPSLKSETIIPIEMRGINRPVALYKELIDKYKECR